MHQRSSLQVGDVLVQHRGFPWVILAQVATGHPYPHARVVSRVINIHDRYGALHSSTVMIIEDGKQNLLLPAGVSEYEMPNDLDDYEVWRPNCDEATKLAAVEWMRRHRGEPYAYGRLGEIVLLGKLAVEKETPGMDDDTSLDNRPKICSELIAMGFYRSGYDLVPHVQDRNTLPYNLRNPLRLSRVE